MTQKILRFIVLGCVVAVCGRLSVQAAGIDIGHVLRSLSHRQTVRLQQGVERLANTGRVTGSPSLRIPSLMLADADIVASAQAVAASWDVRTARVYGAGLASSARAHGINVLAIPSAAFGDNVFLNSRILAATVRGVQSGRVIAAPFGPTGGSGDERSLHERDWPPIEYAIEAGNAGAVTCRLRSGETASICGNRHKFAAMVTSEAHFGGFGIDTHSSDLTSIDRIIGTMSHGGLFNHGASRTQNVSKIAPSDNALSNVVVNGAVLLQNDANVLPLTMSVRSIAIIGGDDAIVSAVRALIPQATITNLAFADASAVTVAQTADASIIVLGTPPAPNEADIIRAIGAANPRTVVLFDRIPSPDNAAALSAIGNWSETAAALVQPSPPPSSHGHHHGGAPPPPSPVQHPPAALLTWGLADLAPQEVARLIFGTVSPSGHLPDTVGAFPSGTGLSYTTFETSALKISYGRSDAAPVTVGFVARNSGTQPGTAVEQLYLHYPTAAPADDRGQVLVAFARVSLPPGRSKRLTMPLSVRSFAYWSTSYHAWFVAPGTYHATVGTSAGETQAEGDIHITAR